MCTYVRHRERALREADRPGVAQVMAPTSGFRRERTLAVLGQLAGLRTLPRR